MFHCRRLEHALLLPERNKDINNFLPIFMLHPPYSDSLLLFCHDHIMFVIKQLSCKKGKSCSNANTDTPRTSSLPLPSPPTCPLLSTYNNTLTSVYNCLRNNHHSYYYSNSNSNSHHNESPDPTRPLLHLGLPIQILRPFNYKCLPHHTQRLKPCLE